MTMLVIYAKLAQAFGFFNAQLNAGSISSSNPLSVAETTVNDLSSNESGNQTFNGAWGNLGVDNNQNKSAMLYVSRQVEIVYLILLLLL